MDKTKRFSIDYIKTSEWNENVCKPRVVPGSESENHEKERYIRETKRGKRRKRKVSVGPMTFYREISV